MDMKKWIQKQIDENMIVLFMKGKKEMPMCGFSNAVVQLLNQYGLPFVDINILETPEMRNKLSEITNWPTIPQLFIDRQFIGGSDITLELHKNGELKTLLENAEKAALTS